MVNNIWMHSTKKCIDQCIKSAFMYWFTVFSLIYNGSKSSHPSFLGGNVDTWHWMLLSAATNLYGVPSSLRTSLRKEDNHKYSRIILINNSPGRASPTRRNTARRSPTRLNLARDCGFQPAFQLHTAGAHVGCLLSSASCQVNGRTQQNRIEDYSTGKKRSAAFCKRKVRQRIPFLSSAFFKIRVTISYYWKSPLNWLCCAIRK